MKKIFLLFCIPSLACTAFGQVGIGITTPQATLDIIARNSTGTSSGVDGLLIPRLDRARAQNMTGISTSTLVYINNIATGMQVGKTVNVDEEGYYYYNGTIWVKLHNPANNSFVSTNIYSANGSLSGNRIVTQNANTLSFTGTAVNAFSVDGTTFSVDASNKRVGIGTISPQRTFHVNTNSAPVRLESLATLPVGTASTGLVIDNNGDVFRNNTISAEGQILRMGLNANTYNINTEAPLRFNSHDTSAEMGNAPNSAPNFINTIVGLNINAGVTVGAGQGAPSRTTDQILLQPGIYKVQVRLIGTFGSVSSSNSVFLKSIVNNSEYSFTNFTVNPNQITTFFFDDYINITGTAQPLDFTISPSVNNFTTVASASPGTGNSYRSLILIQRLR